MSLEEVEVTPKRIDRINNSVLSKIIERVDCEEGYVDTPSVVRMIREGSTRIQRYYKECGFSQEQVFQAYEGLVKMANEYYENRKDVDLKISREYRRRDRRLGLI